MPNEKNSNTILIFHPTIAPYRIRLFNDLYDTYNAKICLYYRNLKDNKFDYSSIERHFHFIPNYFSKELTIQHREFHLGHFKKIKETNPRLIITGEFGEGLWAAIIAKIIYKKKYKIVVMCDDSLDMAKNCSRFRRISRALTINRVDGLILCNEKAKLWYEKKYRKNCCVFPIIQKELDFYSDRAEAISLSKQYLEEYELEGKRVYLFVGRLSPEKNLEYLIRSFIYQHENHKESILFIIGGQSVNDPSFLERAEKLVSESDASSYIKFLGRKEGIELKAWFYLGQILVLPSTSEAFGAVVNEALLAGEYVMVSDRAGAADLVNNRNGEVININRDLIDFSESASRVNLLSQGLIPQENKMPYDYYSKFQIIKLWIDDLLCK